MLNFLKKRKIIGYSHTNCKGCGFKKCKKEDTIIIKGQLKYLGNKKFIKPIYNKDIKKK